MKTALLIISILLIAVLSKNPIHNRYLLNLPDSLYKQYYCFPKKDAIVAKARLAAEEMYKLHQNRTADK